MNTPKKTLIRKHVSKDFVIFKGQKKDRVDK